jgi:hypothetical protein
MNRERFARGKLPQPHKHGCRVIGARGLPLVTAEGRAGPDLDRARGGREMDSAVCPEGRHAEHPTFFAQDGVVLWCRRE